MNMNKFKALLLLYSALIYGGCNNIGTPMYIFNHEDRSTSSPGQNIDPNQDNDEINCSS